MKAIGLDSKVAGIDRLVIFKPRMGRLCDRIHYMRHKATACSSVPSRALLSLTFQSDSLLTVGTETWTNLTEFTSDQTQHVKIRKSIQKGCKRMSVNRLGCLYRM